MGGHKMKRIKAACLMQTIIFQPKEGDTSDFAKQQVQKEYEHYKELMIRRGTKFEILEEISQANGSIIVKLKKQNNAQPVGDYFD